MEPHFYSLEEDMVVQASHWVVHSSSWVDAFLSFSDQMVAVVDDVVVAGTAVVEGHDCNCLLTLV